MSSPPLPNYLRANRKCLGLSQEEVAFLVGFLGESKGSGVSRDESFTRDPSLRSALAYALIYQKTIDEIFAGLRQEVEKEVATRAKLLTYRKGLNNDPKGIRKRELFAKLAALLSKGSLKKKRDDK